MWSVDARNNVNGNVVQRSAHVLINCGGVLNSWQWPTIEGLHKFHGPLLHSANWDERVSLEGKSVGLIGNG
jgi:cation diffusion facilitator CzcD-associated flavoprotein CzcO